MLRRKLRTALKKHVVFFHEGENRQEYVRYKLIRYMQYLFYASRQGYKTYEPLEFDYLLKHLREDDVFLDIGANKGYYSLVASDVCREVYSFEPDAEFLEILTRSIETQNIRNITALNFGLFSRNQRAHLKRTRGKVILEDSLGFSIKQTDLDAIHAADAAFPEIELRVFDDIRSNVGIEQVDFIKMDIEGAELHAIMGMRNTLIKNKPRIILSVHPSKMVAFRHNHLDLLSELREMGYSCSVISGSKHALTTRNEMANYTISCH